MMQISAESMSGLEQAAGTRFAERLRSWIAERPELAERKSVATLAWCQQSLEVAKQFDIDMEDDVARFARLRLLRGDPWLQSGPAQEILRSERSSQVKAFQLECLHWGVAK